MVRGELAWLELTLAYQCFVETNGGQITFKGRTFLRVNSACVPIRRRSKSASLKNLRASECPIIQLFIPRIKKGFYF